MQILSGSLQLHLSIIQTKIASALYQTIQTSIVVLFFVLQVLMVNFLSLCFHIFQSLGFSDMLSGHRMLLLLLLFCFTPLLITFCFKEWHLICSNLLREIVQDARVMIQLDVWKNKSLLNSIILDKPINRIKPNWISYV